MCCVRECVSSVCCVSLCVCECVCGICFLFGELTLISWVDVPGLVLQQLCVECEGERASGVGVDIFLVLLVTPCHSYN